MNIFQLLDERWDSALTAYGLTLASAQKACGLNVFVGVKPGSFAAAESSRLGLPSFALGSATDLRQFLHHGGFQIVNCHTGSGHFQSWLSVLGRPMALVRTRGDARSVKKSWARRVLYHRTDAVIAASGCIGAQYIASFPALHDRLSTVYPGMQVPAWSPEPEGPLKVGLVGRLDPVKGHEDFITALGQLRPQLTDEQFLIAGEEKNLSVASLRSFAEKHGVAKHIRFLGRLRDVGAFMRSCHVGVITSVGSEALSRVCLEWMAQGRPVVATAVGCLPELVSSGDNGFLVPPRNPQALAHCLSGIMRKADFRHQMGHRAHEEATRRFGIARMATETEKVYEEALRRRLLLCRHP